MEKLLFEIGTEEIPAKFMPGILKQLQELAADKMQELRIPFENIKVYGTPRRMTFIAVSYTHLDVYKRQAYENYDSRRQKQREADNDNNAGK